MQYFCSFFTGNIVQGKSIILKGKQWREGKNLPEIVLFRDHKAVVMFSNFP